MLRQCAGNFSAADVAVQCEQQAIVGLAKQASIRCICGRAKTLNRRWSVVEDVLISFCLVVLIKEPEQVAAIISVNHKLTDNTYRV